MFRSSGNKLQAEAPSTTSKTELTGADDAVLRICGSSTEFILGDAAL